MIKGFTPLLYVQIHCECSIFIFHSTLLIFSLALRSHHLLHLLAYIYSSSDVSLHLLNNQHFCIIIEVSFYHSPLSVRNCLLMAHKTRLRLSVFLLLIVTFCEQNHVHGEPKVPCYFIFGDSLVDSH